MEKEEIPVYHTFKVPVGFAQIPLQAISYFINEGSKTKMFYNDGSDRILSESLKNLEAILHEYGFIRIHQRCILNLRQELNFCTKTRVITLPNKNIVYVAKDRVSTVKNALLKMAR
jgi:DNA-binding LytR/AlgR family response regulator